MRCATLAELCDGQKTAKGNVLEYVWAFFILVCAWCMNECVCVFVHQWVEDFMYKTQCINPFDSLLSHMTLTMMHTQFTFRKIFIEIATDS